MPGNKVPAPTTRPRLLSDIDENPLSESAIPEEYIMHRPSSSPALQPSAHRHGQQGDSYQLQVGSYNQYLATDNPVTASVPDPGIIGQPHQSASSGKVVSQDGHLQSVTSLNPQMPIRHNENRRSVPVPPPIFTMSPAVSEANSPSQSQFTSFNRSFSQASLASRPYPSRPRTPTPTSYGSRGKGRFAPRSSSLPGSPKSRRATPHPYGKPSVKHLTCFWWKMKGDCRFAEDDCLYAHRDTGLLADAPRQVTPGEPAKAGRHLEKALENLRTKRNPSCSSLNTSMIANPSTPESQGMTSRSTTPVDIDALQERVSSLQTDNSFLRNLVEQSSKEKSILMTTIEGLQKENSNLNQDVEYLKDLVDQFQKQQRRLS